MRKSELATRFGRRKGNLIRSLLDPKSPGIFSAGLAKNPPNEGPKIDPRLQTSGMIENALGCNSFSGTISATMVRMIPTFPLHPPARALAMIAIGSEVEAPHIKLVIMVRVRPVRIVGFLPNLSEALPQTIAVTHCDNEKTEEVIPAHFATSFWFTPKLSIISGK